jgi:hypothetical protein
VDAVVGTSGGAMTAIGAARMGGGASPSAPELKAFWVDAAAVKKGAGAGAYLGSSDVFGLFGLLRFLAAALLLFGMWVVARIDYLFRPPAPPPFVRTKGTLLVRSAAVAVLVLTALLIHVKTREALDPCKSRLLKPWDYSPVIEAPLFFALAIVVFFAFVHPKPGPIRGWHRLTPALLVAGLGLLVGGVAAPPVFLLGMFWLPSLLIGLGGLAMASGVAVSQHASPGAAWRAARAELRPVLFTLTIVAAPFVLLLPTRWTFFDLTHELTWEFWVAHLLLGLLLWGALFRVVRTTPAGARGVTGWAQHQVAYLTSRGPGSYFAASRLRTLSFVLTLGALPVYLILISPALYSNVHAIATFRDRLRAAGVLAAPGNSGPAPLQQTATLVLTGTNLRGEPASSEHEACEATFVPFPRTDGYVCAGAPDGGSMAPCRTTEPWYPIHRDSDLVVDAAFGSGSPFPVFPGHQLWEACGERTSDGPQGYAYAGSIVDGGYTHNVPLEAAKQLKVGQVLVIESTPNRVPAPLGWSWSMGDMARYGLRLLPFLFERSQRSDQMAEEQLFVAVLSPTCPPIDFPFLGDFRHQTVRKVLACADRDIAEDARVGRVLSWGRPTGRGLLVRAQPRGTGANPPKSAAR